MVADSTENNKVNYYPMKFIEQMEKNKHMVLLYDNKEYQAYCLNSMNLSRIKIVHRLYQNKKLNTKLVEPYHMKGTNPDELESTTFHKNKL
jgi:hypothetical protein